MLLGKHKKFNGTGFVCFLDVLGFSEDILSNWGASDNNPLEKLLAVKREMPMEIDESDSENFPNVRTYVCRVSTVSDSVTICFGFESNIIVGDLVLGFQSLISNIIFVWKSFINYGYTIRGAVDFGPIYWDEQELIGPAFINAYRLESSIAKTSRVILSSDVNKVLLNLCKNHSSNLTDHLFDNFRVDLDGYLILDPHRLAEDNVERNKLLLDVCAIRDKIATGIVREKYTPLIHMLSHKASTPIKISDLGRY